MRHTVYVYIPISGLKLMLWIHKYLTLKIGSYSIKVSLKYYNANVSHNKYDNVTILIILTSLEEHNPVRMLGFDSEIISRTHIFALFVVVFFQYLQTAEHFTCNLKLHLLPPWRQKHRRHELAIKDSIKHTWCV